MGTMGNLAVLRQDMEITAGVSQYAAALLQHIEAREAEGETGVRAKAAKALRISAATLSQYLAGKYPGNVARIDAVVVDLLAEHQAQVQYQDAAQVGDLVMTKQIAQGLDTIEFAVRHKGFALIVGEAGTGKSSAMKYYAAQHQENAIYVDLQQEERGARALMLAIFRGIPALRKRDARWDHDSGTTRTDAATLKHLAVDYLRGGREVLLIDEANNLNKGGMESIRTLQQAVKIPVILSGTYELDAVLGFRRGRKQVNDAMHRRIMMRKELAYQVSREDVTAVVRMYGTPRAGVVEWLYERCNMPGRRYGYLDVILTEVRFALQQSGLGADITAEDLDVVERILQGKE